MTQIFDVPVFEFPYSYKFPGQGSDERILFVTRENKIVLFVRQLGVTITALTIFLVGAGLSQVLQDSVGGSITSLLLFFSMSIALVFSIIGWWWVTTLWRKSLALVTTQRLTKIIYTTPFNRHFLSLPLDMIVDTGSYTKGFIQAMFNLGTFTARSSATSSGVATDDSERVNKKYFYIENIESAEDLQNYSNKLLYAFRHYHDHLLTFRPFIPKLKGEARKKFMEEYPDYWS